MTKRFVAIRFLSKKILNPENSGKELFEFLFEKYPDIKPEYTNYYEPFNIPITDVESALKYWWSNDFDGRRRSTPRGDWSVGKDISENFCFSIDLTWKKSLPWYEIFCDIQKMIDPYFGYVHLFSPVEKEVQKKENRASYRDFTNFLIGVTVERKGIHDLGWANCFGGHYLEVLPSPDAIREAGAEIFSQGNGYILKFSDDISDMLTNFEDFDRRRTAVKALFPKGTFQPYHDPEK